MSLLKKHIISFFLLVMVSTFANLAFADANVWQSRAYRDLHAAHAYLLNDSVGGRDGENVRFINWLDLGYQRAKLLARQVNSASSYNLVMNYYLNGFNDEHVEYFPYLKRFNFDRFWPGFTIYYRNKQFYVSALARAQEIKNLPPVGAKLVSCDGASPYNLMRQRVFPYFGNIHLQADWFINAPRLFFYEKNPWFKKLNNCKFSYKKHKLRYRLNWYKVNTQRAFNLRQLASYSHHPITKITNFTQHGIWVSLATFLPLGQQQRQRLRKVIAHAKDWRNKQFIVIDVRGNTGGNSIWGTEFLQALYGADYFQQRLDSMPSPRYQWRVSQGNMDEISSFYLPYAEKAFGQQDTVVLQLKQILDGIKMALKNKQSYFPSRVQRPFAANIVTNFTDPVRAKIYLLTDGRCASSCLTFVDQLFLFPHVVQIGQATNADSYYTDVRLAILPSGARLYFPMKVQRYRMRKRNQAYIPQGRYYYTKNINNTHKIKSWLLRLIAHQ